MGYDLHITRAEHWFDNEGCQITWEEWLTLVADDPELSPDPENDTDLALWNESSRHDQSWLLWGAGNITAKYPHRALIAKMIQIANRLGAKVQGDDGEIYLIPPDW